jgi:Flp pilus assembly protein TadG
MRLFHHLRSDQRGVAAVEFALVGAAISVAMLNAIDVARYYYSRMEVQNAAQMGAQAAWAACDTSSLPATTNCASLTTKVTAGIQSTGLGTAVTLQSGSPSEGYYCVNSSGVLTYVSSVSTKPTNCTSVGNATDTPGDHIRVAVTYTFTPIFSNIGVTSFFPATLTATSMMRMQ